MRPGRRIAALVLVGVCMILAPVPAAADADTPALVMDNADEPLVVGATSMVATVMNASDKQLTVSVDAVVYEPSTGQQVVVPTTAASTVAGSGVLVVTVSRPDTLAHTASGWLTVRSGTGVARRPIQVLVPSGVAGSATWSAEWTAWPWERDVELRGTLPVVGGDCADVQPAPESLPVVAHESDSGLVPLDCRDRRIVFTATRFSSGYGDYTGTTVVGATTIALTIHRTAPIWAAAFFLLVGLFAALWVQQWVSNGRSRRMRLKNLDDLAKTTATPGDAAQMGVITAHATDLRGQVKRRRPWWPRRLFPWPTEYAAEDLARFDREIQEMQQLVDNQAEFVKDLGRIRPIAALPDEPWALGLQENIRGLTADVETLPALVERARLLAAAPDAWRLVELTKELDGRITAAEQDSDRVVKLLAARARRQHNRLRGHLARVERPTEASTVDDALHTVVDAVDELPLPPAADEDVARPAGASTPLSEPIATAVAPVLDRLREWGSRVVGAVSAGGIAIGDGMTLLVVLVAGVWSGLAVLYVGSPWGTWTDCVAAVVWGFATPTLVAPVLEAVRRLGSRRTAEVEAA